jgi:protein SCO1/2
MCDSDWWKLRKTRLGVPVDTLMLYCYHYDPATGKYGAVVMNIMKVAGVITVGLIVGMLLVLRKRWPYANTKVSEARP